MASRVLKLTWRDSTFYQSHDRFTREEAAELTLIEIETSGFLVHENKERIILAVDSYQDEEFRGIVSVPKVNIVKREEASFG